MQSSESEKSGSTYPGSICCRCSSPDAAMCAPRGGSGAVEGEVLSPQLAADAAAAPYMAGQPVSCGAIDRIPVRCMKMCPFMHMRAEALCSHNQDLLKAPTQRNPNRVPGYLRSRVSMPSGPTKL